jgi:nickel-dependent lactate racemase
MMEGARKARLDFIINVVTNSKKEVVQVVSGDMERAWLEE